MNNGFFGEWHSVDGPVEVIELPQAMEPLVDYYRSKNLLRSVDGMMPMDEVAAAIRRVIGA